MLQISFRTIQLQKLYPLRISRGSSASTENLFVIVNDGKNQGYGELAPATGKDWSAARGELQLCEFVANNSLDGMAPHDLWQAMRDAEIDPPAMAALDMAIWDLLAKQAGLPLYRLLGLPKRAVPTSLTAGLNPPEVTRERVPEILSRTRAKFLKIKLGAPEGLDYDRAHFTAAAEAAKPFNVKLRVDANGGWDVPKAKGMMAWLAEWGVDYVEQPLPEGSEDGLPELFQGRPLPIYIDESCKFASDVAKHAPYVDGVNLKLMKCGGITEAVRIVATARAHGLGTMIGCMSEASVGIAAGAAMSALFDHIDLDSHLNLTNDPGEGLILENGVVLPPDKPGHGVRLVC